MCDLELFSDFQKKINENVNTSITEIKLKISKLREDISEELQKQKDAETIEDKARSINVQANLYQKMPGLLRDLSSSMMKKANSGDSSHIY